MEEVVECDGTGELPDGSICPGCDNCRPAIAEDDVPRIEPLSD
jgi:hypothetical protein